MPPSDQPRPASDPSVWAEPHLQTRPIDLGSADNLGDEPARADAPNPTADETHPDSLAASSVRDEPSLAWNRDGTSGVDGYGEILAHRIAKTRTSTRLGVMLLLVLAAGPFGIFGAFWSMFSGATGLGYLAVTVTGPVVEEMTKVALILWIAERRPWLFPGAAAIVLVGILSGAAFGAIENLIYLHFYFPAKADELAPWRWFGTLPMHAVASAIAAGGVARAWSAAMRGRRPLQISAAFPWIVAAMVLHGAYNAAAIVGSLAGVTP